ncbi:MAG: ABC transporter permease subunit [Anaerolineales bacterium]
MRDFRTFILISVYLGLISLVIGFIYYSQSPSTYYLRFNPSARTELGKNIFYALILIELVLINFISPGLTAGSITSERERQTLDLLKTTLLSPVEFILGKFWPAFVYILLLIFTTLPILSITSILGGFGIAELIISTLILIVTGALLCAMGVFISSGLKRTTVATVVSYGTILFPVFIVFFLYLFIDNGPPPGFDDPKYEAYWIYGLWSIASINPFSAAALTQIMITEMDSLFIIYTPPVSGNVGYIFLSPWIILTILYVIMTITILYFSTRLINRAER